MFKKIISCLMAGVIFACSGILGVSAEGTEEKGRFFKSESIPTEVSEYAINVFNSITSENFKLIGLEENKANNYLLSKGIKVNYLSENNIQKYYFPILDNNKVVALLTVDSIKGELVYSLGKNRVSDYIDKFSNSKNEIIEIFVKDSAVYFSNDFETKMVYQDFDANPQKENIQYINDISKSKNIQEKNIQEINIENTYKKNTTNENLNSKSLKSVRYGLSLDGLVCVPNISVNGHGQCWAASLASAIEYMKYGRYNSDYNRAVDLRDELINNGWEYPESNIIEDYTQQSLSETTSFYSWADLKNQIIKDIPMYAVWGRTKSNGDYITHAVVICGYDYYKNTSTGNRMYIMDPNCTDWQMQGYSSIYASPSHTYTNFERSYYKE